MKFKIIVALLLTVAFAACRKGNTMSKIPVLVYLTSTEKVKAGSSADTVFIDFRLEDGDADIATNGEDINLFISNTRDTDKYDCPLPYIGDEFKDPAIGLKATCIVRIPAAFLLLKDTTNILDSVQFKLMIKDEAGNMSNEIITKSVYLKK